MKNIVATEERIFLSKRASIVYKDQKGVKYIRKQGEYVRLDKIMQKGAGGTSSKIAPLLTEPSMEDTKNAYIRNMFQSFKNKEALKSYLTTDFLKKGDENIKAYLTTLVDDSIDGNKFPIYFVYSYKVKKHIILSEQTRGKSKIISIEDLFIKHKRADIIPVNYEQQNFIKLFITAFNKTQNIANIYELSDNLREEVNSSPDPHTTYDNYTNIYTTETRPQSGPSRNITRGRAARYTTAGQKAG